MKGYTLSGGERRRVELARLLASSPRFALLDEPFTGIDPIMVGEVQTLNISPEGARHRGTHYGSSCA